MNQNQEVRVLAGWQVFCRGGVRIAARRGAKKAILAVAASTRTAAFPMWP